MTALIVLAFLVGALFGMRYKVLVLVPAIALAWLAVVATGVLLNNDAWSIVLAAVAVGLSAQTGYVFGIFTQWVMVMGRMRHHVDAARIDVDRAANLFERPASLDA